MFGFRRKKDQVPALTASNELMAIHAMLIDGFRRDRRYHGFERYSRVEVDTLPQLAGVVHRHFDVHFYKALDAITRCEAQNPGPFTSVLRQEEITIVDLGAGIGTFSAAVADFLYQRREQASIRVLNVILVEPNRLWHDCARWLFGEMQEYLGFDVGLEIVAARYPEPDCLSQAIEALQRMSRTFVIMGMSNLLNWLKESYHEQAGFLLGLISRASPLCGILVSIEPKDKALIRRLSSRMKSLYSALEKQSERCLCTGPETRNVTYRHFPGAYYHKAGQGTYRNTYISGFVAFKSGVATLGNLENLRTAYFKARMALRREFPCDEVAIKLLERRLDRELERCARALKRGYEFVAHPLHYNSPKNEKEYRIRVLDNIYDALVATVFLDHYGRRLDKDFLEASCGNRINQERQSEYIYVHFWYAWYHRFILPLLKAAPRRYRRYGHLDIASFYPSVRQKDLLEKLLRLLPGHDTELRRLVQSLILRDYEEHRRQHGLPQGPVASGFLANLYLHEVDQAMQACRGIFYRRYVDDFYLLAETEERLGQGVAALKELLGRLGLELKEEKTEVGDRLELYNRYCDPRLDALDRRLRNTLRRLYDCVAGHPQYLRVYRSRPQEFLAWYANCLKQLGIVVSPEWLHRKISYRRRTFPVVLQKVVNRILGKSVALPRLEGYSLPDPRRWAEEFRAQNPTLWRTIETLREELKSGLEELYKEGYLAWQRLSMAQQKRVQSHLRFYTYRASVLTIGGVNGILGKLARQPWICSIAVLRAYPEVLAKLVADYRNLSPYMRSAVLWAIGEARDSRFGAFLSDVILDERASPLVKLMASQAMLRIGSVGRLTRMALEKEMNRALGVGEYVYLKNLILLWGACGGKPGDNAMARLVEERSGQLPDQVRWLIESALENTGQGLEIMAAFDVMPDWLSPEDYPEWEDVPEIVPLS